MANLQQIIVPGTRTIEDSIECEWSLDVGAFKKASEKKIRSCSFNSTAFYSSWYLEINKKWDVYSLALYLEHADIDLYATFDCELEDCHKKHFEEYKWTQNVWMKVASKKGITEHKVWEWPVWMTDQDLGRNFWSTGDNLKVKFLLNLAGSLDVIFW